MKNKPKFTRHESHKKKGIKPNWRAPKGLHNKVRLGIRGYRIKPDTGYRTAILKRGKTQDGKRLVLVTKTKDLEGLKTRDTVLILASNLGVKKRLDLLLAIKEKNFAVLQGDVDSIIKKINEDRARKKKESEDKKTTRSAKKKTEEKKKKEEKKVEETTDAEEEKKKAEKQEKDKILTKKE